MEVKIESHLKTGATVQRQHRAPQDNRTDAIVLNPFFARFSKNPYPAYKKLRENQPIRQSGTRAWLVSRYADVSAALTDTRLSVNPRRWAGFQEYSSKGDPNGQAESAIKNWIVMLDAPEHTAIRNLIASEMRRQNMHLIADQVADVTDNLLSPLLDYPHFDFIREVAIQLPLYTTCKLLGIPLEYDQLLLEWCRQLLPALDPLLNEEEANSAHASAKNFMALLNDIAEHKMRNPGSDLLSGLLASGQALGVLSREKILANCVFLFLASHETTSSLIGNGMLALLNSPDQFKLLATDATLGPAAVEEALRYDSPVQFSYRNVRENFKLGDCCIEEGDQMLLLIGSANRDPDVFPMPDVFDIRRPKIPHLAFGRGHHACLGVHLARLQAKEVFTSVAKKFPRLRLANTNHNWKPSLMVRGLYSLPVEQI